jgi:hypothetical protein
LLRGRRLGRGLRGNPAVVLEGRDPSYRIAKLSSPVQLFFSHIVAPFCRIGFLRAFAACSQSDAVMRC